MINVIWQRISRESKLRFATDALQELAAHAKDEKRAQAVLSELCRRLDLRKSTIAPQLSQFAVFKFSRHFDRVLSISDGVFVPAYLGPRANQLNVLYRLVGFDPGNAPHPGKPPECSPDQFTAALQELERQFGKDDALLLLAGISEFGFQNWRLPARDALLAAVQGTPDQEQSETASPSEPSLRDELDAISALPGPSLRLPDNLIISEVIRIFSSADSDEALGRSRMLVEDFRALDPARAASYFHVGLIHALANQPQELAGNEINASRRSWYLAGYLQGALRRSEKAAGIELLFSIVEQVKLLEDPAHQSGAMPYIVHPGISLCKQAGSPSDLARLVANCHPLDGIGIGMATAATRDLIRQGKFDAARAVHAAIPNAAIDEIERRPTSDPWFQYRRAEATLLRVSGRLQEAADTYQAIWNLAISNHQRLLALDGIILCAAGIRDYARFAVTQDNQDAIRKGAELAIQYVSEHKLSEIGPRTMAILALDDLLNAESGHATPEAADRLRTVRDQLQRDEYTTAAYDRLVKRIDAYAAMLDLRGGIDERAEAATLSIASVLRDEERELLPPIRLCAEALQNALICGVSSAEAVASAITDRYAASSLDALPHFEIGRKSDKLAARIVQYLNDRATAISPRRMFEVASSVMLGMLGRHDVLSRDSALSVFAIMERAASSDGAVARSHAEFLGIHKAELLRFLVEDEVDESIAAACLRAGLHADAAIAMIRRMQSALRDSDGATLRQLVDRTEQLGAGDQIPEPVRRRVDADTVGGDSPEPAELNDRTQDGESGRAGVAVEYYALSGGRRPVLDFADDTYDKDPEGRTRYIAALNDLPRRMLTGHGDRVTKMRGRQVSTVSGGTAELWEYRAVQAAGAWVRILFARIDGRAILLHAFSKRQNQIPNEEIETAEGRLRDYMHRF